LKKSAITKNIAGSATPRPIHDKQPEVKVIDLQRAFQLEKSSANKLNYFCVGSDQVQLASFRQCQVCSNLSNPPSRALLPVEGNILINTPGPDFFYYDFQFFTKAFK
jgi:hypothetical protein